MYVGVLPACMSLRLMEVEAWEQEGCPGTGVLQSRWLEATMWVLGTELEAKRVGQTLNS